MLCNSLKQVDQLYLKKSTLVNKFTVVNMTLLIMCINYKNDINSCDKLKILIYILIGETFFHTVLLFGCFKAHLVMLF